MPHRSRDARLKKCKKHYVSHRQARLAYAEAYMRSTEKQFYQRRRLITENALAVWNLILFLSFQNLFATCD